MKTTIFDFNRTLYNPDTNRLMPSALTLLRNLKKRGSILQLISRKEAGRQQIIDKIGIAKYFNTVLLTDQKDKADFTKLAGSSKSVFVIGDRIQEEITIGNQLGYTTIWLKAGRFSTELPRNKAEQPTYIITRLSDALKILA